MTARPLFSSILARAARHGSRSHPCESLTDTSYDECAFFRSKAKSGATKAPPGDADYIRADTMVLRISGVYWTAMPEPTPTAMAMSD